MMPGELGAEAVGPLLISVVPMFWPRTLAPASSFHLHGDPHLLRRVSAGGLGAGPASRSGLRVTQSTAWSQRGSSYSQGLKPRR